MFFDSKRPQDRIENGHAEKGRQIGKIGKAKKDKAERGRAGDEQDRQSHEEGRKNPEGSADVEPLVIVRASALIDQQTGNEKAGKDKEKVHTETACPCSRQEESLGGSELGEVHAPIVGVIEHHHKDGNAADGVEFRHLRTEEGSLDLGFSGGERHQEWREYRRSAGGVDYCVC